MIYQLYKTHFLQIKSYFFKIITATFDFVLSSTATLYATEKFSTNIIPSLSDKITLLSLLSGAIFSLYAF